MIVLALRSYRQKLPYLFPHEIFKYTLKHAFFDICVFSKTLYLSCSIVKYLFKVSNKDAKLISFLRSKLTMKTPG